MQRFHHWLLRSIVIAGLALGGCALRESKPRFFLGDKQQAQYQKMATDLEYPAVNTAQVGHLLATPSPKLITPETPPEFWDLPLEEVVRIGLANSKVFSDLGGRVVRAPEAVETIHEPAIVETDPRFGVEAALAEFDAQLTTAMTFEKNDRALNNVFFGGGTRLFQQDLAVYQTQLGKRSVTGALFAFRNHTEYDANNAPGNRFPSAWTTWYDVEVRQPLLQGAGVRFNRIAGPDSVPGFYNGVLIARINTDISLTEFEAAVRDLVSNIENAYWDLYLAYRDLDARIAARDAALESWRTIYVQAQTGRRGAEPWREAEAREQYFRFKEEVLNAWSGRLIDGTQNFNGSSGGTLRQALGLRVAERRLRLLMGLPINDERLIRPVEEPSMAKIVFDWQESLEEALVRRTELRRQRWLVKRRELELVAARNYLLPDLDTVARYRWRGFGDLLLDPDREPEPFHSAYQNLTSGDFQEWQLGVEFTYPFGNRLGHLAVRNSQLQLARDRAVLAEQEAAIVFGLSNAIAEVDRAYEVAQAAYNRRLAARVQLQSTQVAFANDQIPLFEVLEAQRRLAEAESRFYAALVEHMLALKNVHFEKGSLLDYNEIYLAESPWPAKAYQDASSLTNIRHKMPWPLNYILSAPPVSGGKVPQMTPLVPAPGPKPVPLPPVGPAEPEVLPAPTPLLVPPPAEKTATPSASSPVVQVAG